MREVETLPKGVFRYRSAVTGPDPLFPFGLGATGVHEIAEAAHGDRTALAGFALAALPAGVAGAVVWITEVRARMETGRLSQGEVARLRPGLSVLSCEMRKTDEALWACEEAIRSGAARLVVAEVSEADFTATRRLALASERSGAPLLLMMPHGREGASAAAARWRVSPRASAPNRHDPRGLGAPRWRAVLERCRAAPEMAGRVFDLEVDDETFSLTVASGLAAGPVAPGQAGGEDRRAAAGGDWRQVG